MKTKITILLIALFVLAFSAQALAQTKDVALVYGAETQTTDVTEPVYAETILVQLNSNLVDPTFSWTPAEWDLILGDFKILDGATLIPVTAAEISSVDTNFISLSFDFSTYHFGPDKNDLKLHYLNYSGIPITTDFGNLQNTSTAVNIDDGIAPIFYAYSIQSNNAGNTYLGEAGDVVTFSFVADEALSIPPDAPLVTFTVPELKYSETVTATTVDPLQKTWTASFTIPDPGSNLDGLVSVSATFWDVHANAGSLSPAVDVGTDGTYVIVKNYDPATVYVNHAWTSQADVTPGLIWQWDAFKTITTGIAGVADPGTVIVHAGTTGIYNEDLVIDKTLELKPYGSAKAYDVVTLKGTQTELNSNFPNAGTIGNSIAGIEINADGVKIHDFTIETPDLDADHYAFCILLDGSNIEIYNNTFNMKGTTGTPIAPVNDQGPVAIQTWTAANGGTNIKGLNIHDNKFQEDSVQPLLKNGYYGAYLNVPTDGDASANRISIKDNTFDGRIWRAVTSEHSYVDIQTNTFTTTNLASWNYGKGISLHRWGPDTQISSININTNNVIQGSGTGKIPPIDKGFQYDIIVGYPGSPNTFSGISITGNTIKDASVGVRVCDGAAGVVINGNAIVDNSTYGVQNDVAVKAILDAENNWWGSANGPTHIDNTFNVTAQGDASSNNVDYVPWYNTNMTGTSFAPVLEDDGSTKVTVGYYSSFQTAIDGATAGNTINCVAGTYTENANVNKSLSLVGASSATVTVTAANSGVSVFNVTTNSVNISEFTVSGASGGGQAGIYIGAGVSLCNIFDNVLTGNFDGIWLGDGSNLNTLTGNTLTGNYQGFEVYISDNNTFTSNIANSNTNYGFKIDSGNNNAFTSNIANSNTKYGFYVVTGGGGGCSNTTFTNNTANLNTTYGIRINGGSGTTLTGNTFDSNGTSGVRFKETMTTLTMTGNTITNNPIGIEITDSVDDVSTWAVNYNHIVGNTNYGISNAAVAGTLNAEDNWWGSTNGPVHIDNTFNVGSQGDISSNFVDYVPWYNTDMGGSTFAPVKLWEIITKLDRNTLREENLSFKDVIKDDPEQFSSIQTAIDAYGGFGWAWIYCYAGTFTEDFVADKDDIWFEAEVSKQLVTLLGDQEVTGNNIWFDYFEFDPLAGVALRLNSSAATIDGTYIYGCTFTLTESGDVGIYVGGSASPNALTYTYIEDNIFNGPTDKNSNPFKVGGWFGTNIGCEIDGLYFEDNEVNYGSIPFNLVDKDMTDIYIGYNDFLNTDGVIYFWNNSTTTPTGKLSYFDFSNNYVPGSNSYGVAIGGPPLGDPIFVDDNFGDGIEIYDNAFEMSGVAYGYYGAVYMADQFTGLLDASYNWWGDANGPENDNNTYTPPAAPKGRATVSDRVEFAPWWNDGTDAAAGRGWEPAGGTTLFAPVINITQTSYHSSIQRGVDGAIPNDVLTCIAGTFTEDFIIPAATTGLELRPHEDPVRKAYDDVTIKGVASEPWTSWPLAVPNIEILADDTYIHDFTIESPNNADLYYSSGMVIDGEDVEISYNNFVMYGVGEVDPGGGVIIQTYRDAVLGYDSNISGLYIHHNEFSGEPLGSYVGIFINHQGVAVAEGDDIDIMNNTFDGYCYQGIVTERDWTGIYFNDISRSYPLNKNGLNAGITKHLKMNADNGIKQSSLSGYGIIVQDWDNRDQKYVTIEDNLIENFFYGILVGRNGDVQDLTDISIKYNEITENHRGIYVRSDPGALEVYYNSITDNETAIGGYGILNNVSGTSVDATKNWWGDATGPNDDNTPPLNPHTTPLGDNVSVDVIFIPWYATSTVHTGTEYVRTHQAVVPKVSNDLAFADAIQPGIDAAAGDYFYVQVTDKTAKVSVTYTENLIVDHEAYIYGGGDKATPPVTIIGTHVITGNNVTFDEFILTPGSGVPGTVITINSASQLIEHTTITDCQFDIQTSPSIGVYVGGATPNFAVSNSWISGCTFNGPADKISNPFKVGGSFGSPVGCEIDGLYFGYNYVNDGSIPINLADKDIYNLSLSYNTFASTDGVIYFWAEDAVKSPTGEISYFTFANNYVGATNSYGVGFDVNGNFTAANYGLFNYINENYFDAAIPGAYGFDAVSILTPTVDLAGYEIDACSGGNWWGSADGPDHDSNTFNVPTQGVEVSDNVDFVPWYDSGVNGIVSGPGWEPDGAADLFAPVEIAPDKAKAYPYYASIQAAINGASSSDEIICYEGTFYEDFSVPASKTGLYIHPYDDDKDYEDVTIKGQATVDATLWPLAAPNIEILGAGTMITYFTIEAPDYVEGYYSSGIVVGAQDVEILCNTFINNVVANPDDISQSIQTYKNISCTSLIIDYNTFTDNVFKTSDWGYEAIYLNPGCGYSYIEENYFLGMCLRAITLDNTGGGSYIYGNNIQTSMAPKPDGWATPGAYQGINLQGDLSNIEIFGNYIGGNDPAAGFDQGIRLGYDGDTFTNIQIGGALKNGSPANTIKYNSYGILCKSASGVSINYNVIEDNAFGVQNDDTGAKAILDATYNYWGAADGPSFTFDYGIGSGSGDEVSEYVDFYPWYQDEALTTEYTIVMAQFLLSINPDSPYVDNYFDLRVCAADAAGIRDFSYGNLADFSSSHVALSVPEEQLLVEGFKEMTGACISSLPFEASDHLTIFAWEYNTNPPTYYSNLTDIEILELNNPAAPTGVNFTDLPNDNGGWILVDYTLSIDDPFYTTVKDTAYGVSYYVVEIDTLSAGGAPDYHFLANISCYNNGLPGNDYTALLPAPASDTKYNFRMASVYNPNKFGGFDENHISYNEIVTKDAGAQSAWQTGSAAPKDNLPAYFSSFTTFIQGPYSGGTMTDGAQKPLISPYDGQVITALPLPNDQIVDWVYVELRLAATGATVKEANAFLLNDGSIVDVDGNSSLPFYYTTDVEYYFVIHHRNHIDIMSAVTHTFGDFASQGTTIDLTGAGAAYGGGFADFGDGNYGLYGGDVDNNNTVSIGDAIATYDHRFETGYLIWDFNMNGSVTIGDAIACYDNRGKATTIPNQGAKDGGNDVEEDITNPNTKDNTADLQISNPRLDSGKFKMEIQLKRTSEWPYFSPPSPAYDNFLLDADFQFSFNTAGFAGSPTYSNLNAGISLSEYTVGITAAGAMMTFSLTGPFPINTNMYSPVLNVWETVCTVEWDIADPNENSGIDWSVTGTGIVSAQGFGPGNITSTFFGSGDITLPVELSSFNALFSSANENIELRWDTATETDVNGFNIYRSEIKDLTRAGRHINYSLITAAGTTSEPQSYIYSDVVADVYVTHYYWLEVVDFGGTSSFHGPYGYTPGDIDGDSTPDLIASTELLGNFPNPAINSTQIRYQIKGTVIAQNATISVYNVRGEFVKAIEGRNGVATLDTSDMGHGIYFYRLQTDDYSDIKKLIVVK